MRISNCPPKQKFIESKLAGAADREKALLFKSHFSSAPSVFVLANILSLCGSSLDNILIQYSEVYIYIYIHILWNH